MRKLLLTSSQVSVLLTSFIIISCGVALFLSGYVIQQRTLRDLRSAIRPREPRPKPATYLPEHFRVPAGDISQQDVEASEGHETSVVEILSPSTPEQQDGKEQKEQKEGEIPGDSDDDNVPDEKMKVVQALMADVAQKSWAVEHPDPLSRSRVPVTRAERRRLIKEEIQRLAQGEEKTYYQRRLW